MYKIKGLQAMRLSNITRTAITGYSNGYCGKILNEDGSFIMYDCIHIHGQNNKDTKLSRERTGNYTITFSEVPCDAKGNPLMTSYTLTTTDDYLLKTSIFCSKEPTHRINLQTGAITDNNCDNDYIRNIDLTYLVYDTDPIAI